MKTTFISLAFILFSLGLCAQQEISVSIDRNDYKNFTILLNNGDTVLMTKEKNERIMKDELTFSIIQGKGGQKDDKGDRERRKHYLVNSAGDTILCLRKRKTQIEFTNGEVFHRNRTKNGWDYMDTAGNIMCSIELLWNNSVWNYTLKYYAESENIENLKKVNFISLVSMAYYRSKCDCEDEADFWFFMHALQTLDD